MQNFVKAKREAIVEQDSHIEQLECLKVMLYMGVHFFEHRRVEKDMWEAYAKISPFFAPASEVASAFLERNKDVFTETSLFRNAERAENIPDRRRPESNITMPPELWKDWMKVQSKFFADKARYPREYDKVIRPIIARRKSSC